MESFLSASGILKEEVNPLIEITALYYWTILFESTFFFVKGFMF